MSTRPLRLLVVLAAALLVIAGFVLLEPSGDRAPERVDDAAGGDPTGIMAREDVGLADDAAAASGQRDAVADGPQQGAAPRPERRWSDLLVAIDDSTGMPALDPVVLHVAPDGAYRELQIGDTIDARDLVPGSLLALDTPDHLRRAFRPSALDLDAREPAPVRLERASRIRIVESSNVDVEADRGVPVHLTWRLRDRRALALGRALGLADGEAETRAVELGQVVWSCLDGRESWPLLPDTDPGARRAALERLAQMCENPRVAALFERVAGPPPRLVFGRRTRLSVTSQTVLEDCPAGVALGLDVRYFRTPMQLRERDSDVVSRGQELPLVLAAGTETTVDLAFLHGGRVEGRVPVPVSGGRVTLWGRTLRDLDDPDAGWALIAEASVDLDASGRFAFENIDPGSAHVDARWLDELGVQRRAVEHFEVASGDTVDLGLLATPEGATLTFVPRLSVDGVPEALDLEGCHFEVLLFATGKGADGSATYEVQRRDARSFGLGGVAPGTYAVLLSGLQLLGDSGGSLRAVSTALGCEREITVDADRTIEILFELERVQRVRLEAELTAIDLGPARPQHEAAAIAWNRATGEVLEANNASHILFLERDARVTADLPLRPGTWTVALVVRPRLLEIDTLPVAGSLPSFLGTREVVVDGTTADAITVELEPATVVLAPVRDHGAPLGRRAAVVPADWPDAAAMLWSRWDGALGAQLRIHGCPVNTRHREPGSANAVVSAGAGAAVALEH